MKKWSTSTFELRRAKNQSSLVLLHHTFSKGGLLVSPPNLYLPCFLTFLPKLAQLSILMELVNRVTAFVGSHRLMNQCLIQGESKTICIAPQKLEISTGINEPLGAEKDLRNKTYSPCLHSLVKTKASIWENLRADQWKPKNSHKHCRSFHQVMKGRRTRFISFITLLFSDLTKRKTIYEAHMCSLMSFMKL